MIKIAHPAGFTFFSDYVMTFCRPGTGADTCRFLVGDIIGGDGGLHCGKHDPELAARLNKRVADGTIVARGDNCPGKPSGEVL